MKHTISPFCPRTQRLIAEAGKFAFEGLVIFELDLTYFIPLQLGVNMFIISDIELLENEKHMLIIVHDKAWAKGVNIHGNQVICVKPNEGGGIEYTSEISQLSLGLMLNQSEIDKLQKKEDIQAILLQDIMHSIRNKLLETKGLYVDVDVNEYGMRSNYIYKYDLQNHCYILMDALIMPSYNYEKKALLPTGNIVDTDKHSPAVLFAHKCEIAYQNHENYDCVLYASIAIESLANELLRSKEGLYEKFYAPEKRVSEISFYRLVCVLENEKIISNETRKKLLFGHNMINEVRTMIVHGKATDIRISRQNAEKAYGFIIDVMSDFLKLYYQNQKASFTIVNKVKQ